MKSRPEQESNKVSDIPMSYTRSHPGAMMVMNLHTYPTGTTMERPWWSQNFAAVAIRHFVMPIKGSNWNLGPILIQLRREILELFEVVELRCIVILRNFGFSQCGL